MIGQMLGGRYQILERVGGGGMAIVYRGLDVLLHRPVAVKTLRPDLVSDMDFVRRFKREAQAAASLSHPNIVNIYDVGQDGEILFIVMEYVDGKTLKQVIEDRSPIPVEEAIAISKQICDALAHAHEHKIIHRDVKPHNILMSSNGRIKVTDFGIARAVTTNTITHHNSSVIGSVHYLSPEQARGGVTDEKSDVYSLGVVLYEMLTGRLPFSGDTPISVALKHLQEPIVEPRSYSSKIPQSVENIVLRALRKDPTERYSTIFEMAKDLDRSLMSPDVPKFLLNRSKEEAQAGVAATSIASEDQVLEAEANPPRRSLSKRILIVVGWVFGAIALIGVAAVTAFFIFVYFIHAQTLQMPNVVGMPYANARNLLVSRGFAGGNIHVSDDQNSNSGVKIGQVENQDPAPGKVPTNQNVDIIVKTGTAQISMPALTGFSQSAAVTQLNDLGMSSGNVKIIDQPSGAVPVNQVISTIPVANTTLDASTTTVTLFISSGTQSAAVPDVQNKSLKVATDILKADGFLLGKVKSVPSFTVSANQVISQTPLPGEQAASGSSVRLTVSSGQPPGTTVVNASVVVTLPSTLPLPVNVRIDVTDALGTRTAINTSQNNTQVTYQVNLTTTPAQAGQIVVYENGQIVSSQTVTASNSQVNVTGNGAGTNSNGPGSTPTGSGTGTGSGSTPTGSGTGTGSGSTPTGSGTGTGSGSTPTGSSSASKGSNGNSDSTGSNPNLPPAGGGNGGNN